MSTIKSSDEHLTLNADGSSKDIKFQANGVEKASISSSGAFTSTTIDATKLTGALPAISGAALTGVGVAGITSTADATAITIDSSERVGIGTTSPSSYNSATNNLVIRDTATGGMTISTGATNSGFLGFNNGEDTTIEGLIEYNHSTDAMSFRTNSVDNRIVINSNGHVTMPLQPSFLANGSPSKDGSNNIHSFGNIKHNIGSHYVNSNGRFTAPVAGRYLFSTGIWAVANTNNMLAILINGSGDYAATHVHNTSASGGEVSVVLNLAVNDYVSVACDYSVQGSTPRNFFSGHLLG